MQIKVEIVARDGEVPDAEREAIQVETHARRGDTFAVLRTDTFLGGADAAVLSVPPGGRLVINTPLSHEEAVYDRDQAAAVRPSQQAHPKHRMADKPVVTSHPEADEPSAPSLPPPETPPATEPPPETSGRRYKPPGG